MNARLSKPINPDRLFEPLSRLIADAGEARAGDTRGVQTNASLINPQGRDALPLYIQLQCIILCIIVIFCDNAEKVAFILVFSGQTRYNLFWIRTIQDRPARAARR